MIRILLVDDQKMIREALQSWLEPELDLQVIGMADNGLSAVEQVEKLQPDVVLMNMEMPGLDGVSATKFIKSKFDEIKVIILSSFDTDDYISRSLSVGAQGYLLKSTESKDIISAIRSVHKGYTQLGPGLLDKVLVNGSDSGIIINQPNSSPKSDTQEVSNNPLSRDKQLIARSKKAILTLQSTVDQQKEELFNLKDDFKSFKVESSSVKKDVSRHSKISWLSLLLLVASLPLVFLTLFGLNSRAKTLEANSFPIERVGLNREYDLNGLAQRVEKTFKQDPLLSGVSNIFVAQSEGVILLKGSVDNPNLLDRLEEMALAVKGVSDVNTEQVEVLTSTATPSKLDSKLWKKRIFTKSSKLRK